MTPVIYNKQTGEVVGRFRKTGRDLEVAEADGWATFLAPFLRDPSLAVQWIDENLFQQWYDAWVLQDVRGMGYRDPIQEHISQVTKLMPVKNIPVAVPLPVIDKWWLPGSAPADVVAALDAGLPVPPKP